MNFVIGLVYKWFGRDMLERLFATRGWGMCGRR